MPENLLPVIPIGISEIAILLNVDRKKVAQWKFHNKLPEPDYVLQQGPIWDRTNFILWYQENGIIDNRKKGNRNA